MPSDQQQNPEPQEPTDGSEAVVRPADEGASGEARPTGAGTDGGASDDGDPAGGAPPASPVPVTTLRPLLGSDPARVGPYPLLGRLGAGGMGRVYLARSPGGRIAAVKVVHEDFAADEQFRARFRREISAARRVGGPFTAPVLDADAEAERPWVATGFVPGPSLEEVVRSRGTLPPHSVRYLAEGLLKALKQIHAAEIVHRDLKPSNVLLTVEGPRVIDFGIARAMQPSMESLLTSTGMVIGTPGFMAPEQVRGEGAVPASDVFALGCVLAYAATGKLAFGHGVSNQQALMFRVVAGEPELDGIEDEEMRSFVESCLTRDLAARPGVDELLRRLGPNNVGEEGSWLPAPLVAVLARRAARLLEIDTPVSEAVPEEPHLSAPADGQDAVAPERTAAPSAGTSPSVAPDRPDEVQPPQGDRRTVALRNGGAGPAAPGAEAAPTGPGPEGRAARRRRRLIVAAVALAIVVIGAGALLVDREKGEPESRAPGPSPTVSNVPGTPVSPSPSADGDKDDDGGKDDDKGKDDGKGKDKDGDKGDGGGSGSDGGAGDGGEAPEGGEASGSGSGGAGSGSGGSGSGSGSGGGSGGSGSGGDDPAPAGSVPRAFLGTWHHRLDNNYVEPVTITFSQGSTGDNVATLVAHANDQECTMRAELRSVGSDSRLSLSAATKSGGSGACYGAEAATYRVSGGNLYRTGSSGVESQPYAR